MLVPAQMTSRSILSTMTDPSGAVVAGAEVTIDSVGRGLARHVSTNEADFYSAPALDPGEYDITIEKAGFKKNVRSRVSPRCWRS
jgi:Carboxypeptidase regulatory-like domain